MKLHVSDNRRFLQDENGAPFFLLADTAWELLHRLSREEIDFYLQTRRQQGFNTIFTVALAEFDGLRTPNFYGDLPLHDLDPARPNRAYFAHFDYVVDKAQSLGMFIGLLPSWGDKWYEKIVADFVGPEVFTPENACSYGRFLGERYANKSVIWILGGDREILNDTHRAIIEAMSDGLTQGARRTQLRGFHPKGGESSAKYFHDCEWLDFNMIQSGHCTREQPNHDMVAQDYALNPPKPCMDGEPRYENHPIMELDWTWQNGLRFGANDVRRAAYHAVFAGACGHVYGCHDIWQMNDAAKREAVNNANLSWREALFLEGATQMRHLRSLMESRNFFARVPDDSLIISPNFDGRERIAATKGFDGSYAFVYIPSGHNIEIDCSRLSGKNLVASWFDPRNGETKAFETFAREGSKMFAPPNDDDWVLVLDAQDRVLDV